MIHKSILIDAYLLIRKSDDSYYLSLGGRIGDPPDRIPMIFVKSVDINNKEYDLYSADVNRNVTIMEYDQDMIFTFSMTRIDENGHHHQDSTLVSLTRGPTHLDSIIDADNLITMSRDDHEDMGMIRALNVKSYLFRFANPLIVVDNV